MCAKYIQYLLYLVISLKSIVKGQMIQIELLNSGLKPIIKEKESNKKALHLCKAWVFMWSHLGSNQGPSDYESDALTS